jgi:hypothetical protein
MTNYSLELSNIPLEYLELIISTIIIKDDVDGDNKIWNRFRL